jgi:hypothetical protein
LQSSPRRPFQTYDAIETFVSVTGRDVLLFCLSESNEPEPREPDRHGKIELPEYYTSVATENPDLDISALAQIF